MADQSAADLSAEAGARERKVARAIAIAGALLAVAMVCFLHTNAPDLPGAQRATKASLPAFADGDGLHYWLLGDIAFILSYLLLGLAMLVALRPDRDIDSDGRPIALAGMILIAGAATADVVEDLFLRWALDDPRAGSVRGALAAMRAAGAVKWALLAAAIVALILLLVTRPRRHPFTVHDPGNRPPAPKDATVHPWDPPARGTRLGICLSGGGIRSAAFALGGIQALQDNGRFADAEYLAAASGGGYLAAGWAVSDAQNPGAIPEVWSPGSPEERWFRDHSSYLIPDLARGARGVGRLVAGVVVNFVIIWLVLYMIARPVGWAGAAAHPELKAIEPVSLARDTQGEMAVDPTIGLAQAATAVVDGAAVPSQRFQVRLVPKTSSPSHANEVCFDDRPFAPGERQPCFNVTQDVARPGVVEVRAGRAVVLVQPKVVITPACLNASKRCDVFRTLKVEHQPKLAVKDKDDAVDVTLRADQLEVAEQPIVRSKSGLRDRPAPTYAPWMWEGAAGPLGAAALLAFVVMGIRPRRGRDPARFVAVALALTGLACLLVTIALPALATWLPKLAAHLPGTDTSLGDSFLPSGGLVAVSIAAARQYLLGGKKGAGTGASTPPGSAASGKKGIWARVTGASEQLNWYDTSPTKILLLLLLTAGFILTFVAQLQYSMANGFKGQLLGLSFFRDRLPDALFWPEWVRFVVVGALMGWFAISVDAHAWSLYPFYKRRLSSAYILRQNAAGRAEPIPYNTLLPFTPEGTWPGLPADTGKPAKRTGPKLVTCCAVNLSEPGIVPPGRRAASFTFGSDYIGGPLVGYVSADAFWNLLPLRRRRDITIPSAMAISGAAFSPAMGKTNLGPIGSVLALANLRLGVWLPHPQRVTPENTKRWEAWHRPGWPWFLREVMNKYRFQRRYLYVSDGGHWDNLGLVELLRRGCTEIICISAAGDGPTSFGTIAEAIALARDELGVDIALDPSALRAPVKEDPPPKTVPGKAGAAPRPAPTPRELRRAGSRDTADPFAPGSSVTGTYRWRTPDASGTIRYIETALTRDLPFDVHGFAESEAIFPDDATGDQVFSHRQFEAFRKLGYHQVDAATRAPTSPTDPVGQ